MVHHVCRQDARDDTPPCEGKGLLVEAPEDVAVLGAAALQGDLEHPCAVVVLQRGAVVVPDGELALRHHLKGVAEPSVVDVVAQRPHDGGEDVHGREVPGYLCGVHELEDVVHRRHGVVEVVVGDHAVRVPNHLEEVEDNGLAEPEHGESVLFLQHPHQQAELLLSRQSPIVNAPLVGVRPLDQRRGAAFQRCSHRILQRCVESEALGVLRRRPPAQRVGGRRVRALADALVAVDARVGDACHRPLGVPREGPLLLVVLGHQHVHVVHLLLAAHLRLRQHDVHHEELQVAPYGLRQGLQQLGIGGCEAPVRQWLGVSVSLPGAVRGVAPNTLRWILLVVELQHPQQPSL
mmetsp:Transcript_49574/g.131048  ORF Transcript_49574/g.131048 Transcript_49574/m.131048 type:complete len:349 (-) Transcript_49574:667-1713(-)